MKLLAAAVFAASTLLAAHSAEAQAPDCARLRGFTVAATDIGLPTHGASVTAADVVPAAGEAGATIPAHCLVSGEIRSRDASAPNIRFRVALPMTWNGKALMLGGGGFSGSIPAVTGSPNNIPPTAPSPLSRGYAVFGSDAGHQTPESEPGSFMLNAEALRNWQGDHLKKTRDAVGRIITVAYGRAPERSYFVGGSTGGGEALFLAGLWPADFDGIVSLYPAVNRVTGVLGGQNMLRVLRQPGAWMNPAERDALFRAAHEACDGVDGIVDGLISNARSCNSSFNPRTATLNGAPLRCPEGRDTADTCLSDAQITALETINRPVRFGFPLANGDTEHPGYNAFVSDWGRPGDTQLHQGVAWIGFGFAPPDFPPTPAMSLAVSFGDNYFRYGVARGDRSFNSLVIDPTQPNQYASRLREISTYEAGNQDLSRFASEGGRLMLVQGAADTITSPRQTSAWYEEVRERLGPERTDRTIRFYEIPGWNHSFSTNYMAMWDYLTALENWVERGVDPAETQVVADAVGVPGRTRPLCQYPRWPRYNGTGEVNAAASFSCTAG